MEVEEDDEEEDDENDEIDDDDDDCCCCFCDRASDVNGTIEGVDDVTAAAAAAVVPFSPNPMEFGEPFSSSDFAIEL